MISNDELRKGVGRCTYGMFENTAANAKKTGENHKNVTLVCF
jgi:hypothetical protein